jgi:hypothetical protein
MADEDLAALAADELGRYHETSTAIYPVATVRSLWNSTLWMDGDEPNPSWKPDGLTSFCRFMSPTDREMLLKDLLALVSSYKKQITNASPTAAAVRLATPAQAKRASAVCKGALKAAFEAMPETKLASGRLTKGCPDH